MKTNVNLWWILTGFFLLLTAVYTGWNIIEHSSKPWYNAIEWVGTIALLFSAAMSVMIGFYVNRVHRAQGGELPEDTFSAALGMIGLAVGSFLLPIAGAVFLVAIVGWVYEYYRGYFAR